ncbi:hypothetical protein BV898_03364 [Hypsibius exemplaris]|uniref:HTH CENPB-type domain-containing protein n=1 Tax=Hypsibius exemplaris TaxID=2072580 RepID=A0A1W0X513_HYPEX|nr:hypothetical protein BV898_03364 [Hypsibius exemplaris]
MDDFELVYDNGLPCDVSVTDEELMVLDDRLMDVDESDNSAPESSSHEVFEPNSDHGNLKRGSGWKNAPSLEYKMQAVAYWKSGKKKRLSLPNVQNRFVLVTSKSLLFKWAQQIDPKSRLGKMRRIFEITKAAFDKAEGELTIIHDCDLTKWARDAAGEVELSSFRVSKHWIQRFKKLNNIGDRKITEYYVKELITSYGPDCVLNADQSGFQYEIHSGRTLRTRGTKKVKACVQSISKMTHSYTIMPIIDANGKLFSPLFIVMKEVTGEHFGPSPAGSFYGA